jgi:hypothetical protein
VDRRCVAHPFVNLAVVDADNFQCDGAQIDQDCMYGAEG